MAESHVNTFDNGMTKDYSVVLQPDGTYRHMANCSLISQDGNNFVVKDALGNVRTFAINAPYDAIYTQVGALPMVINFFSFPDGTLVAHSTNAESIPGGYGEIGLIQYAPYGEGIQPLAQAGQYNSGYIPLYHHAGLNFTKAKRIEGFGFEENELIKRVYWTDNLNEPKVFNINNPIFTTYFASGSLVVGEQYMVLEGAITHNAIDYGPGLTAGNIFTAVNANYTNLTAASPSPKVISYYPLELLAFTPNRAMGNITYNTLTTGNVICGSKMYFYRLITEDGDVTTSWSYGSSLIHVGTKNVPYNTTGIEYHDFVGGGTPTINLNSELAVVITINNIDTNYGIIEVACAEFDNSLDVPRQITVVAREPITGSEMDITHDGNNNFGNLTLDDISLFPASILTVKTITTSKNYLLGGNFTERQEFELEFPNLSFVAVNYPMISHLDPDDCGGATIYDPGSPVANANPGAGTIMPFSRYLVTDVSGGNITYNAVSYGLGQVFTGTVGVTSAAIPAGSQCRPCVTKNRYTTNLGARRENAIELASQVNDAFWDYKSAAVHHHMQGYWSNEIYRFGVLFYDLKGHPFYVKHLADFQFPAIETKQGLLVDAAFGGGNLYYLNPTILRMDGLDIPASIIDQISGFSIVRAERIPRIITQGLVTQCVYNSGVTQNRAGAYNPIVYDEYPPADKLYTYLCPDIMVNNPMRKAIGVTGDNMEEASWLSPFQFGGGNPNRQVGGGDQIVMKLFDFADDNDFRTGSINYWADVLEDQTISGLPNNETFQNRMSIQTAAPPLVEPDGTCIGGAVAMNNTNSTGGKKVIFKLDEDFNHFSSSDGYTSVAADVIDEKILMNYVKSGVAGNPYGDPGATVYISTGHYQAITDVVKSETFNGVDTYSFNDVHIAGGDCFTCLIDYGYGLWNNDLSNPYSYGWFFPCECNSNYNLRKGRKVSNVSMFFSGCSNTNELVFLGPSNEIRLEDYIYNPGYSSEGQTFKYPGLPTNFVNAGEFKTRIRFAGEKINGELTDSFRTFLVNDYKDIDVQGGEINVIRVKDGHVWVWQNNMITTVPILERQLLSGLSGAATTLGTGGVVDRFDPINSYYGTQHQWSVTATEFGFVWFDMRRKAFMALDSGIGEVSFINGLKGYFDEVFLEALGVNYLSMDNLLNSPTFAFTSDQPLLGVGIHGVYDPKFKMTYMTFKFKARFINTDQSPEVDVYKAVNFTIGYYHPKRMFVGFYDWYPAIAHNHNQFVLSSNDPKNTTQYLPAVLTGTSYVVGDTLESSNSEYICILAVTLDNVNKFPEGINGSTYWTKINSTNELWVHNQPAVLGQPFAPDYQYNKFFGRVVNNTLQIVVNPNIGGPFEVQFYEQAGPFNVNYTDITFEAINPDGSGPISASDNNISSTSRLFRFIWDRITGNTPRTTKGRLVGNYLLVTFTKKNWTGSAPTVVSTSVKILQSIISYFVPKR